MTREPSPRLLATIKMDGYADINMRYIESAGNMEVSVGSNTFTIEGSMMNERMVIDSDFLVKNFGLSETISKHVVGDYYYSEEDAAMAFGLTYNKVSVTENIEYGAVINKDEKGYYLPSVFKGETREISSQTIEMNMGYNPTGIVHTHAANMNANEFSWVDVETAQRMGLNMYLASPSGLLLKLNESVIVPEHKKNTIARQPSATTIAIGLPH